MNILLIIIFIIIVFVIYITSKNKIVNVSTNINDKIGTMNTYLMENISNSQNTLKLVGNIINKKYTKKIDNFTNTKDTNILLDYHTKDTNNLLDNHTKTQEIDNHNNTQEIDNHNNTQEIDNHNNTQKIDNNNNNNNNTKEIDNNKLNFLNNIIYNNNTFNFIGNAINKFYNQNYYLYESKNDQYGDLLMRDNLDYLNEQIYSYIFIDIDNNQYIIKQEFGPRNKINIGDIIHTDNKYLSNGIGYIGPYIIL